MTAQKKFFRPNVLLIEEEEEKSFTNDSNNKKFNLTEPGFILEENYKKQIEGLLSNDEDEVITDKELNR